MIRSIVKSNLIILAATMGGHSTRALVASAPTTITLAMTSDGATVASGGSIDSGARLTLAAAVSSGSSALTTGQVNFCDASAPNCTDIHLLGIAQLTGAGTAQLKLVPGIGNHSYKAVFLGTPNGKTAYASSSSLTATLTVNGRFPIMASIAANGSPGDYAATAAVTGYPNLVGLAAPHGKVSFVDATNDNRLLGTTSLGASVPALNLLNSSIVPTGKSPVSVATGDFNNDGIPDLAIANEQDDTVTVLLGNGDGTFRKAPQSSIRVGLSPDAIAVGDFNGDGKIDLAVANACGNPEVCAEAEGSVTILLGNGDGTFTQAKNSPVTAGFAPSSIAVADFNGDGIPDLVTADFQGAGVTILLGKGDGTFVQAPQSPIAAGGYAWSVAVGDFNGDGVPDLAVADRNSPGSVTILLGNGDGTFTPAKNSPMKFGYYLSSVAVGDFNGDGKADLAVVDSDFYGGEGGKVVVLLGNGDGTFTRPATGTLNVGYSPVWVVVGDFSGDGIPDLAVVNDSSPGTLSILVGKGDGTFALAANSPVTIGNSANAAAEADFNGDGISDLAVVDETDDSVLAFLSLLTETATTAPTHISPIGLGVQGVTAVYAGDANYAPGASAPILLSPPLSRTATVLTMTSGGKTIASGASLPWGSEIELTASVIAHGKPATLGQVSFCNAEASHCSDVSLLGTAQLTRAGNAILRIHPGIGHHAYKASFSETPNGATSNQASASNTATVNVIGKFPSVTAIAQSGNASSYTLAATVAGLVDAPADATPEGSISFLDTTDGNHSIAAATLSPGSIAFSFSNPSNPHAVPSGFLATGDFNGDGYVDLVASNYVSGTLTVLLSNGDGAFAPAKNSPVRVGLDPGPIAVADFNGDGKADLAVANTAATSISILLGAGNGTFTHGKSITFPAGQIANFVTAGDFNRDGIPDLAIALANGTVAIFLGKGDGTFAPAPGSPIAVGTTPSAIAVADFNRDGIPDLAVANAGGHSITILLGNGDGTFRRASKQNIQVGLDPSFLAAADFNRDGIPDLAVANSGSASLTILLGKGDGTFSEAKGSPIPVGFAPRTLAVGDFNGDGFADLVSANQDADDATVLLGDGTGEFNKQAISLPIHFSPMAVATGAFTAQGLPGIAVGGTGNTLAIFQPQLMRTANAIASNVPRPSTGTHLLSASYSGDAVFDPSVSGTTPLIPAQLTPLVSVLPEFTSITTSEKLPCSVGVIQGTGPLIPTGSIVLSSGNYTSAPIPLNNGGIFIDIPAGALAVGTDTITATYTPDAPSSGMYTKASGTATVTVTQP